jgi:hypothetical protein
VPPGLSFEIGPEPDWALQLRSFPARRSLPVPVVAFGADEDWRKGAEDGRWWLWGAIQAVFALDIAKW